MECQENGSQALKQHLLTRQKTPIICTGFTQTWRASDWSVTSMAEVCKKQKIKFRIGPKSLKDEVQWETECDFVDATIANFNDWVDGKSGLFNPLKSFNPDAHWCYADYKYMSELFADHSKLLKDVDWSVFGFDGRNGEESTFWMGSQGAYTACHYDSYGCNLVAQIYGRKKWVLFPPSDTPFMYPTRIPYEESSVFSKVNIAAPSLGDHPLFKHCHPYTVILEPGQVLFVPRHWWHYVECLETSISVNSWIEMKEDNNERLKEALTRALTFDLMSNDSCHSLHSWLNPTEEPTSHDVNLSYVTKSLQQLKDIVSKEQRKAREKETVSSPSKMALSDESRNPSQNGDHQTPVDAAYQIEEIRQFISHGDVSPVKGIPCDVFLKSLDISTASDELVAEKTDISVTVLDVLECVTQSDVIELIAKKLKQKFNLLS